MNLKGTAMVTVIYGDYEYIVSVDDGRSCLELALDETPGSELYTYVARGNEEKRFHIRGDYMATMSGWGHYGMIAIDEIQKRYANNNDRLSMEQIVEQAKDKCFKRWEEDRPDESDDVREGKDRGFPATVVVYGLNGEHTIMSNPENVAYIEKNLKNGKKIKVVFHGSGGEYAMTHVSMISDRISSSPTETLSCLMEAMAAGGFHEPSVGGHFLGGILTQKPRGP